jgi:uncharacterized protein YegP (UPF0339 family)
VRWDVYEDQAGQWRWRAVARNGKVLADGAEGYASERNAKRALSAFQLAVREPPEPPADRAATAERCTCPTPKLSKSVSNLCTGCGRIRG